MRATSSLDSDFVILRQGDHEFTLTRKEAQDLLEDLRTLLEPEIVIALPDSHAKLENVVDQIDTVLQSHLRMTNGDHARINALFETLDAFSKMHTELCVRVAGLEAHREQFRMRDMMSMPAGAVGTAVEKADSKRYSVLPDIHPALEKRVEQLEYIQTAWNSHVANENKKLQERIESLESWLRGHRTGALAVMEAGEPIPLTSKTVLL